MGMKLQVTVDFGAIDLELFSTSGESLGKSWFSGWSKSSSSDKAGNGKSHVSAALAPKPAAEEPVPYALRRRDITKESLMDMKQRQHMTHKEIAKKLKCSTATIARRLGESSNGNGHVPALKNRRWFVHPKDARKAGFTK